MLLMLLPEICVISIWLSMAILIPYAKVTHICGFTEVVFLLWCCVYVLNVCGGIILDHSLPSSH